ncbi:MAG: carboxypeptidase-like regulatory domain-containing protein [Marinifilaceae bacterium]
MEKSLKLDDTKDMTLQYFLDQVAAKAGISISYSSNLLDVDRKVKFTGREITLGQYLKKAIEGQLIEIVERNGKIILVPVRKGKAPPKVRSVTLSGYIKDSKSHEAMIGATLYEPKSLKGTTTNVYGFYSISLLPGKYDFRVSYVGYKNKKISVELLENTVLDIFIDSQNELGEVVVKAFEKREAVETNRMSINKIPLSKLTSLPSLMGEKDIVKTIQLFPGIQSGSNGSGLFVRGGGPDQNLMLLDGVPIYNSNHLLGFLSVFSGTAVNSAEIVKGGFPARYGGRLSSVVDVRMKEGDMNDFHGELSLGLLAGKLRLEGPLIKGKTSFSFSARRTWADLVLDEVLKNSDYKLHYSFHDINAKVNHRFSSRSRLYLSYYTGNDFFVVDDQAPIEDLHPRYRNTLDWGNQVASLRWNYVLNPKLFSNFTLTYSNYNYETNDFFVSDTKQTDRNQLEEYDFDSQSDIEDLGIRFDLDYLPAPNQYVKLGGGFIRHLYKPVVQQIYNRYGKIESYDQPGSIKEYANEYYFYFEDDIKIGKNVKINPGMHLAGFHVGGVNYLSFQPRINALLKLNKRSSVKLSYSKMTQFIHLLSNPGIGLPTDLWVPSTDKVKPENAHHFALGFTRLLPRSFELNLEAYYKEMDHLIDYQTTSSYYTSRKNWEEKVEIGQGQSYGIEFLLEKKRGRTTGWLTYTCAYANRKFDMINFGKKFDYKYDRRHELNLAFTHRFSKRFDFGGVFVFGTGHALTLGLDRYRSFENVIGDPSWGAIRNVEKRNNYRLPNYHRLDLNVNFHKQKRFGKRTWSVGVYNVYNRRNPFMYYVDSKENGTYQLTQVSLSSILPYFSYTYQF